MTPAPAHPTPALHLLALASPDLRTTPHWPASLHAATIEFCPDIYAALAQIVAFPHLFDALILDPRHLSARSLAALPLIQRHRPLPLWLLEVAPNSPKVMQALALGAIPLSRASLTKRPAPAAPPTPRAPIIPSPLATAPLPSEVVATPVTVPSETPDSASTPEPAPEPTPAPTSASEPIPDYTLPAPEDLDSTLSMRYDDSAMQPVLSEDELRALLGSEP